MRDIKFNFTLWCCVTYRRSRGL